MPAMIEQEPRDQQLAEQQLIINELCYALRHLHDSMPAEGDGIEWRTGVGSR